MEKKIKRRKPPKTAAVIVTCKNGGYKDLMQEIRAKIKLTDLGIDDTRIRPAMNGGQMIEVALRKMPRLIDWRLNSERS